MNRLTSSVSRVSGQAFAVVYGYDLGGLATNIVYPDGKAVRYAYDADGRVASVTDWANHTWQITRDAAGRMTGMTYPNGVSGAWSYDASHAVTSWGYTGAAGLPGRTITRDAMGLKTREDVTSGPTPVPATNRRAVNTFNAADRLVSAAVTSGTNTFGETYNYDATGSLTNVTRNAGGTPPQSYAYDLAGRLTFASLQNFSTLELSNFSLTYDVLGNRVNTTVNGTNRLWVIDHTDSLKRPLMETDANGVPVRYYIWGAGRLLAMVDADGTTRYAHSDEQGSIVALTDTSGTCLFTASYGPYGEPWGTTGTNATPFGWLGGHGVFHMDGGSLYLTRYRAYDTTLKRFLSQDPMGLGGGVNLYGYANGNPLAYIDPLGLVAWGVLGKSSVALVANGAVAVGGAALAETGVGAVAAVYGAYGVGAAVGNIINALRDTPEGPTGPAQMLTSTLAPDNKSLGYAAQATDLLVPLVTSGGLSGAFELGGDEAFVVAQLLTTSPQGLTAAQVLLNGGLYADAGLILKDAIENATKQTESPSVSLPPTDTNK